VITDALIIVTRGAKISVRLWFCSSNINYPSIRHNGALVSSLKLFKIDLLTCFHVTKPAFKGGIVKHPHPEVAQPPIDFERFLGATIQAVITPNALFT